MDGQAIATPVRNTDQVPATRTEAALSTHGPSAASHHSLEARPLPDRAAPARGFGLRVWVLSHTEVTARDSIGYIRIAWQLQHNSWIDTVANSPQHPGYPLALLAMSYPVRMFSQDSEPRIMQWSAQLASALAGILLVIPMYFLGRILFNPAVGFWMLCSFSAFPPAAGCSRTACRKECFFCSPPADSLPPSSPCAAILPPGSP